MAQVSSLEQEDPGEGVTSSNANEVPVNNMRKSNTGNRIIQLTVATGGAVKH